ncbi:MAG TPA: hypothetical protein VFV00_07695 [Acidimicrobiales bacterium]|nr:hypothetical protein [Acidimicrobiales bacterium]
MSTQKSRNLGRTVAVSLVLALALMWIYVLFVVNPESTEDKLNDPAFPAAAQPVCQATIDQLTTLGVVNQKVGSPQERAALVDKGDAALKDMVQKLRTLLPPPGDDATAISKWLDDWDQWLSDRQAWSEKLRNGEDAPFLEKQRSTGEPLSKARDAFATTNNMQACTTPVGV